MKRRNFIKTVIGGVIITPFAGKAKYFNLHGNLFNNLQDLPKRPLGKTGLEVGLFSLGGQSSLEYAGNDVKAEEIINRALDLGVNYIDTSAYYGWDKNGKELAGVSERYIGKVMKTRRNEVYLATKTLGRTYDAAMRDLETSLKNLKTDYIDLWQVHDIRSKKDLDTWFAKDGAIKAFEKAKDERIIKHIGITGHKDPQAMNYGIESYPFDTILLPLNAADVHNLSFIKNTLPVAIEKNIGIIAMKVFARGEIFKEGGITSVDQVLGYVFTLPISTAVAGISELWQLEENIEFAKRFKPLSEKEMRHLEELTKPYQEDASFYKHKW